MRFAVVPGVIAGRVLELLDLAEVFDCYPDSETAITALTASGDTYQ